MGTGTQKPFYGIYANLPVPNVTCPKDIARPACRPPARSGTRQNDFVGLAGGDGSGR